MCGLCGLCGGVRLGVVGLVLEGEFGVVAGEYGAHHWFVSWGRGGESGSVRGYAVASDESGCFGERGV